MAARWDQSSIPPQPQKVSKSRNSVHPGRGDQSLSIKIIKKIYQPVVTRNWLTGNRLNPHPSDACLTATQQLPASQVKTSDRKSPLPLDANVGHPCLFCSHSYIKNTFLTSYSPQIGSDLRVYCEMCCVCCGYVIFHVSVITILCFSSSFILLCFFYCILVLFL